MKYKTLDNNGKGLQNLATASIKDFKVKMKVARVMRWFKDEAELLQAGFTALGEKYVLENKFNEDGVWSGTEEEKEDFIIETKAQVKEKLSLLNEECASLNTITFAEEELIKIKELTGDDLSDLMLLGLLVEDSEPSEE